MIDQRPNQERKYSLLQGKRERVGCSWEGEGFWKGFCYVKVSIRFVERDMARVGMWVCVMVIVRHQEGCMVGV